MRRLLAIVLFALLPLQFSWAAVASYCEHEVETTGHFGHHEHHHHGDAAHGADASHESDDSSFGSGDASGNTSGDEAPGTVDADCGHCHGTCSVMPMLQQAAPHLPASELRIAGASLAIGAHAPARPERPQWRPLA